MQYGIENLNVELAQKEYEKLNMPNKFDLEQIDYILKSKYEAEELDPAIFPELNNDPFFDSSFLTKCYVILNPIILDNLFTQEEKNEHTEYEKKYGKFNSKVIHSDPISRIHAMSSGKALYIIFQSNDNKYMRDFVSCQGPSEKMISELSVLKGISLSECTPDNINYKVYLLNLINAGYIKLNEI